MNCMFLVLRWLSVFLCLRLMENVDAPMVLSEVSIQSFNE